MDYRVIQILRGRGGSANRRESAGQAPTLRIGRGTDCEVRLEDPRIRLHQATIHAEGPDLRIEARGETELKVAGRTTRSSRIVPGDAIEVGPYQLVVVEPPDGVVAVIEVELVRPSGDDLDALRRRSGIELESTRLSMRALAWLAMTVAIVAVLFLPGLDAVVRFGENAGFARPVEAWSSGPLSDSHKALSRRCEACHRTAFRTVDDQACLECHAGIERHADTRYTTAAGSSARCTSCHLEHGNARTPTLTTQRLCADCHARPATIVPATSLGAASDFATEHPPFGSARASIDLKFSHVGHLEPKKKLTCRDCHVPDVGGVGMLPIRMERHCKRCHELRFDPDRPERSLPHVGVAGTLTALRDHYAAVALREGYETSGDSTSARRLPGRMPAPSKVPDASAIAWADRMARERARVVFSLALCGECHLAVTPESSESGEWEIRPVQLARNRKPGTRFPHEQHQSSKCADCHAATWAETLTDPLLPPIETCRECHGGETATRKVPSTCVNCHDFHRSDMRPWNDVASRPDSTMQDS